MEIKEIILYAYCFVVTVPVTIVLTIGRTLDPYFESRSKMPIIKMFLVEIILLLVPFLFLGMDYVFLFMGHLIFILIFISLDFYECIGIFCISITVIGFMMIIGALKLLEW